MLLWRKIALAITLISIGISDLTLAKEIVVFNEAGESEVVFIEPTESFFSVVEWIGSLLETQAEMHESHWLMMEGREDNRLLSNNAKEFSIDLIINEGNVTVKSFKRAEKNRKEGGRNYNVPVTAQEKKDIRYIITTLAQSSLPNIASSRSSLKRAGDRINSIHPLRFLMTIFADEELKVGMHAIRDRGWIWDDFLDGLIGSLREEAARQNIKMADIQDFSANLGVSMQIILTPLEESRWKDFINVLIDNIPRANDPNRYNM